MIKTVVFDFDGVLVDSVQMKRNAWFQIFADSDQTLRTIAHEIIHQSHGSRFGMLREIFSKVGFEGDALDQKVNEWAQRYQEQVERTLLADGVIPGVKEVLAHLSSRIPLYVNSGTPENPLVHMVGRLGIAHFFKGVYGHMHIDHSMLQEKLRNLQKVAGQECAAPYEILMVGDGDVDYDAARTFGCAFGGVATDLNEWHDTKEFPVIAALDGIIKLV